MNIRNLQQQGRRQLQNSGIKQASLDAELLLCWVLDCDRSHLIAHPQQELDPVREGRFFAALEKRQAGEPIQYIRGKQEFWGNEFLVTPDVLIPRPETELLMENATELMRGRDAIAPGEPWLIADMATGSGCLAVSLALHIPDGRLAATDLSEKALAVARRNAEKHGVLGRVDFMVGDLGEPLMQRYGPGVFDLVVCNPPYGSWERRDLFDKEVLGFEPHLALFGGLRGTETIQRLIPQVHELLKPGGHLLMEIGIDQAERVTELCRDGWGPARFDADLQNIPRCLVVRKTGRHPQG